MSNIDNVKFELTIESGNQAIVDYPEYSVREILESVIEALEGDDKTDGLLFDYNGNRVGEWCLTIEEPE